MGEALIEEFLDSLKVFTLKIQGIGCKDNNQDKSIVCIETLIGLTHHSEHFLTIVKGIPCLFTL